jgi:AbrB family looped-hinge helix DNA binding protein
VDVLIGKRAQVVIPAAVRRRLGLQEGDRLHLQVDDQDRIILQRAPRDPVDRLRAAGVSAYEGVDPVVVQRELRDEWDR